MRKRKEEKDYRQKLSFVREKIQTGDRLTISLMTGYSTDYVRKVIQGSRNSDKIVTAGVKLIEERIRLFTHE